MLEILLLALSKHIKWKVLSVQPSINIHANSVITLPLNNSCRVILSLPSLPLGIASEGPEKPVCVIN